MDLTELLPLVERVVTLAREHAWLPLAALVIGAVVRLAKKGQPASLWAKVPSRWRPVVVSLLGLVAAGLEAVVAGQDPYVALAHGLTAALVAIVGHLVIIERMRGGRELGVPLEEPVPPTLRSGELP